MTSVVLKMNDLFRKHMSDANAVDITAATLKMMIVKNTFVPNQNTDEFITIASPDEVTGTGYTVGGNPCTVGTVTMDGAGLVTVDCNDPAVWGQDAAGFSDGRYAVLYDDTGTPGTSRIVATSAAFASDQGNLAGAFAATIGAAGVYSMAR